MAKSDSDSESSTSIQCKVQLNHQQDLNHGPHDQHDYHLLVHKAEGWNAGQSGKAACPGSLDDHICGLLTTVLSSSAMMTVLSP